MFLENNIIDRMTVIIAALLLVGGCAATKSREQREILEWNTEGYHVYKVENGVEYFVKCEGGLKYIGVNRFVDIDGFNGFYESYGPIDKCVEEDDE